MIVRRSSQGENIRIYRNTTPGATRIRKYTDGTTHNVHGRTQVGKHKMINKVCTSKEDYPTSSNTKDDIKSFLDIRSVEYGADSTKSQLLDIVTKLDPYSELDW